MKQSLKLLCLAASIFLFTNAYAQWTGPTSGVLSTDNYVKIKKGIVTGLPGTIYPPLFEVVSTGSPDVSVFSADHSEIIARKNVKINNASFLLSRSNGQTGLQMQPLGNLTLNTDGETTSNRGFLSIAMG